MLMKIKRGQTKIPNIMNLTREETQIPKGRHNSKPRCTSLEKLLKLIQRLIFNAILEFFFIFYSTVT